MLSHFMNYLRLCNANKPRVKKFLIKLMETTKIRICKLYDLHKSKPLVINKSINIYSIHRV